MKQRYPKLPPELKQLIAKVEGLEIETKETPSEEMLNQFSKSCASFANTQGGSIIIGVNRNGKIVGANIDQHIMDRISGEAANCKPPVRIQLNLFEEEQKTVLQVLVPKSEYLHTDKQSRFPLRTGSVTSFMELGTILAYSKERNLLGKESTYSPETRERRKPEKNEMNPFIEGLSNKDPRIKVNALANLSASAFRTSIENDKRLLLGLLQLLRDPDANVRKSALRLYEILNYHASSSNKTRYNKKILPAAIEVASHDDNIEVRSQALNALVVTRDKRVTKIIVQMIGLLSETEYKTAFTDNVWNTLATSGLGPKLRTELFKEFITNTNEQTRQRIEEIMQHRYLG